MWAGCDVLLLYYALIVISSYCARFIFTGSLIYDPATSYSHRSLFSSRSSSHSAVSVTMLIRTFSTYCFIFAKEMHSLVNLYLVTACVYTHKCVIPTGKGARRWKKINIYIYYFILYTCVKIQTYNRCTLWSFWVQRFPRSPFLNVQIYSYLFRSSVSKGVSSVKADGNIIDVRCVGLEEAYTVLKEFSGLTVYARLGKVR